MNEMELTKKLGAACRAARELFVLVDQHGMAQRLTNETYNWVLVNNAEDRQRLANEAAAQAAAAAKEQARQTALAKLTPEEQTALGIQV
jgi:hypothetical protein